MIIAYRRAAVAFVSLVALSIAIVGSRTPPEAWACSVKPCSESTPSGGSGK